MCIPLERVLQSIIGTLWNMLTLCSLLQSVFDVKAAQMNVQRRLIWEFMLYEFELKNNSPSRLGLKNPPTAYLRRGKTSPKSVLFMTLTS